MEHALNQAVIESMAGRIKELNAQAENREALIEQLRRKYYEVRAEAEAYMRQRDHLHARLSDRTAECDRLLGERDRYKAEAEARGLKPRREIKPGKHRYIQSPKYFEISCVKEIVRQGCVGLCGEEPGGPSHEPEA
jgi:uncharacterized coiled-coil DUF342 family protein